MNSIRKSNVEALVAYVADEQGKQERVGEVSITNCHSTDPQWAALEMKAVQAKNTRAVSDKTYHLLVAFPPSEEPAPEILKAIEDKLCAGLGYREHQRISAVHRDTDHLHLHVVINKIHPVRLTLHEPYYDYKTLGRLCSGLEAEYGLERVNHTPKSAAVPSKASDMEYAAGLESLVGWIQRQCLDRMASARSWSELHDVLGDHGLALRKSGNGLVIADASGVVVKASSVARHCSMRALEARLGPFEPLAVPKQAQAPAFEYRPRPLRSKIDTSALYAEYQQDQRARQHRKTAAWKSSGERRTRRIEAVKRSAKLKRTALRLAQGGPVKRLLYAAIHRQTQAEIAAIQAECRTERQALREDCQRLAWLDWLKARAGQGDAQALAVLRERSGRRPLAGNTIGSTGPVVGASLPERSVDSVTKRGTVIYAVSGTTIRDDGDRLKVSTGATPPGIKAALRMAIERYGSVLSVTGTADFKSQVVRAAAAAKLAVTFDDPRLDEQRQALASERHARARTGDAAAEAYIAERNGKRSYLNEILPHRRYEPGDTGTLAFAGLRHNGDATLALFRRQEEMLVLPVDAGTAARLKRLALGSPVELTGQGTIRSLGRAAGR